MLEEGTSALQGALQRLSEERARLQQERDLVEAAHTALSDIRIHHAALIPARTA